MLKALKDLPFFTCTILNFEEKCDEKMLKTAFFLGSMPQTLLEARAFGARDTCLVCSESLATALSLKKLVQLFQDALSVT